MIDMPDVLDGMFSVTSGDIDREAVATQLAKAQSALEEAERAVPILRAVVSAYAGVLAACDRGRTWGDPVGTLSANVERFINESGRMVKAAEIAEAFADEDSTSVRSTAARLASAGRVGKVRRGWYAPKGWTGGKA